MRRIRLHLIFIPLLAALPVACGPKPSTGLVPAPIVFVAEATSADIPIFGETVATLDGSTNTAVRSQVSGYLVKQVYQEGSLVKVGEPLFQIDPRPFHTDLDKAQDDVNGAKSDSGYTQITSTTTGVAGRAIPGPGDWIVPGMTLTIVSTIDPIQVEFILSRQFYLENAERIAEVMAVPIQDRSQSLELMLADGTIYPTKGKLDDVDRQAPASAGAITARAQFPNPDGILRPGQYVKIRGVAEKPTGAVSVPQQAVIASAGNTKVMVVGLGNTIEIRNVTTKNRAGAFWIISSGLKAGERVVVEGSQQCQPGSEVAPQPYVAPR